MASRSDMILLAVLGVLLTGMLVLSRLGRLDTGKARDRRKDIERRTAIDRRKAQEAVEGADRRERDRRNSADGPR